MPEDHLAVYRLHSALQMIEPPIWRRFEVLGDTTLHRLHRVLQLVMGWQDYHLYTFTIGGVRFQEPPEADWQTAIDSRRVTLAEMVPALGSRFTYVYDFGDHWTHALEVE